MPMSRYIPLPILCLSPNTLQNVYQTAGGVSLSTHNGVPAVWDVFTYPINVNYTILNQEGTSCLSIHLDCSEESFVVSSSGFVVVPVGRGWMSSIGHKQLLLLPPH